MNSGAFVHCCEVNRNNNHKADIADKERNDKNKRDIVKMKANRKRERESEAMLNHMEGKYLNRSGV